MLTGMVNRYEHFEAEWCRSWATRVGRPRPSYHRKFWEVAAIAQVLSERGLLREGSLGLGFGVGRDPLTDLCASFGCRMVATDLHTDQAGVWRTTEQHAARKGDCHRGISERSEFDRRVEFRFLDMNWIPEDLLDGRFDFLFSCSSLEHISGHEWGMRFMRRSLRCLRPGGLAVHTTEFQVPVAHGIRPRTGRFNTPSLSLYSAADLETLAREIETGIYEHRFEDEGPDEPPLGRMLAFDPETGYPECEINGWIGDQWDRHGNGIHMKLAVDGFVFGSCLVVFERL